MAEEMGYVDRLVAEIVKELGEPDDKAEAGSWDYAVATAMSVVGPILEGWERRLGDVREEYRKSLESWDRTRTRLDATIQELRTDWREADQQHARDVELMLWLHAEAAWQREQAVMEEALRWRQIVEQWEQGHQNEVLPYTAKLEAEVAGLKAAIADIDAHATPLGLLHNDDPEGSPHHYLLTVGALHRALGKAYTAEPCESERARLRVEVARLRREVEFEARGDRNFYRQRFDAPPPCSCVTDPWQLIDAGWSRPQCAVHPEGGTP